MFRAIWLEQRRTRGDVTLQPQREPGFSEAPAPPRSSLKSGCTCGQRRMHLGGSLPSATTRQVDRGCAAFVETECSP
jgi:hypothetical protein